MNLLVHFVIYGHLWCFESSQIALACGLCNFENFQNITPGLDIETDTVAFVT